jgi:hypothetical protein
MGSHGADDRPRGTAAQTAVGLIGIVLVVVVGFMAAMAGFGQCLDEVQSGEQAPHICGLAGTAGALWLPPVIGVVVLLLLLGAGLRTRILAIVTAVIVAGEAGLFVMWLLVSHGTIHY